MGGDAVLRSAMSNMRKAGAAVAMPTVEQYAQAHGVLHPEVHSVLRNWIPAKVLSSVRLEVKPRTWSRFKQSGRGSPAPMFVVFGTIYVAEGFLNKPGWLWGNTCDLGDDGGRGWETLVHELRHVQQYVEGGGLKMMLAYAGGVARSLWANESGKRTWNHDVIPMEQDAIAFAAKVKGEVRQRAVAQFWANWKEIG